MKAILKRKYIYIIPTPKEDIPAGLCIKFDADTPTTTDEASCNIEKGKSKYILPDKVVSMGRKVIKVWIQYESKKNKKK